MATQVIDQTPRQQFSASAGQIVFPYNFLIFVKGDITVEQNGTVLTVDVDFTVSDVGDIEGGDVTLTSGATLDDIMTVYRSQGFDRETDYQESGDFLTGTVNDDFNRIILMQQQLRETDTRTLQYDIDDIVGTVGLPVLADRINKALGFDPSGNPVAVDLIATTGDSVSVSSIVLLKVLTPSNGDETLATGYFVSADGGGGHYIFDSTSVATDNGGNVISPNVGSGNWILQELGSVTLLQFGCKGDNGATNNLTQLQSAIQYSADSGKEIDTGSSSNNFGWTGNLNLIDGSSFTGSGVLSGSTTTGTRPTATTLRADGSSGSRLTSLQTYFNSELVLTTNFALTGTLSLKDCLIRGASNNIISTGALNLENCGIHGMGAKAFKSGLVNSTTALIVSDSAAVSLHAHLGGVINVDALPTIVSSVNRSLFVQIGGVIAVDNAEIFDSGSDASAILYGGSISAISSNIDTSVGHGIVINYGGSVQLTNATVNNCTKTNIVSESNGTIFASGVTNTNSGDRGISTSFGGIVNFVGGNSSGHSSFDAQANGSGFINLRDAVLDGTSNGGGSNVMIMANGEGTIFAEAPVTGSGKTALVAANYSPGYNTLGLGAAYIGESSANDATVFTPLHTIGARVEHTINAGVITIANSNVSVDTQNNDPTDDLDTINGGVEGMIIYVSAENSSRTVVLKNSTGNMRLSADITLDHNNDTAALKFNNLGLWTELTNANNA